MKLGYHHSTMHKTKTKRKGRNMYVTSSVSPCALRNRLLQLLISRVMRFSATRPCTLLGIKAGGRLSIVTRDCTLCILVCLESDPKKVYTYILRFLQKNCILKNKSENTFRHIFCSLYYKFVFGREFLQ